jgi:hypothetical protein
LTLAGRPRRFATSVGVKVGYVGVGLSVRVAVCTGEGVDVPDTAVLVAVYVRVFAGVFVDVGVFVTVAVFRIYNAPGFGLALGRAVAVLVGVFVGVLVAAPSTVLGNIRIIIRKIWYIKHT